MNAANTRFPGSHLCLAVVAALSAGCAILDTAALPSTDVAPQRQQRKEAAVREFESRRDLAELQAALTQWNQGNPAACEESLRHLLRRNPDHCEARLLLAEACLANRGSDAAFQEIRPALDAWPDDARVQYTAAMLLETAGQANAALAHYRRAVELQPDNEIYSIGYQTALLDAKQGDSSADSSGPGWAVAEDAPTRPRRTLGPDDSAERAADVE